MKIVRSQGAKWFVAGRTGVVHALGFASSKGNQAARIGVWVSLCDCRLVTNRLDPTFKMVRITEAEVGEPSRERSCPQTDKSALNRLPAQSEELNSVRW
jgi:hypothetical protein